MAATKLKTSCAVPQEKHFKIPLGFLLMHTVIDEHCTGCELCIPVCPVDCISLENISGQATGWSAWSGDLADHARSRYSTHQSRQRKGDFIPANARAAEVAAESLVKTVETAADSPAAPATHTPVNSADAKQAMIAAAMARARAKRAQ